MALSQETSLGIGYYSPSDVTSWLNGFNVVVMKIDEILVGMQDITEDNRNALQSAIDSINAEIDSIQANNTVANSNILALQTALNNVNTTIESINLKFDDFTWEKQTLTTGVYLFYCKALKKVRIEYNFNLSWKNATHNIIAPIPVEYTDYKSTSLFGIGVAFNPPSGIIPVIHEILGGNFCIYVMTPETSLDRFRGTFEYLIN